MKTYAKRKLIEALEQLNLLIEKTDLVICAVELIKDAIAYEDHWEDKSMDKVVED